MNTGYQELYAMGFDRHVLRQRLVRYAKRYGVKPAARVFECSKNTVRKWLQRYQVQGLRGLVEQSRAPQHCPHKTSSVAAGVVVRLRRQTGFGAARLKREFTLPCGESAAQRILREHQLVRIRKRKHKTKQHLREVKQQWRLFQQLSADTKHLYDIPHYWPQMQNLKLPRYQYTVRDVTSGLCFPGYADELSKSYTTLLAEQVSAHLADHGIDLDQVEWQTDNGPEFKDNGQAKGLPSIVRDLGSDHHYIPFKAYTWQSDVETVHRLIEDEFFDLEYFRSSDEFWRKLTTYWLYFNIARPNSAKEFQTPLQLARAKRKDLSPSIASWSPLDLAATHATFDRPSKYAKGGHDVPTFP